MTVLAFAEKMDYEENNYKPYSENPKMNGIDSRHDDTTANESSGEKTEVIMKWFTSDAYFLLHQKKVQKKSVVAAGLLWNMKEGS